MCYILTNAFNRDHYCHIAKEIKDSLIIICFYKLGSQQFAKHFRIANVNPSKSERETQILYIYAHIYWIKEDGNGDPICKAAKETKM